MAFVLIVATRANADHSSPPSYYGNSLLGCAWGRAFDPSLPAGGTFDPFLLALKPAVQMSPLPAWMESPARIDQEGSCIEVAIPPLWRQSSVDRYAVTLVFDDGGDGGRFWNGVPRTEVIHPRFPMDLGKGISLWG